jgi:hypothetical protein
MVVKSLGALMESQKGKRHILQCCGCDDTCAHPNDDQFEDYGGGVLGVEDDEVLVKEDDRDQVLSKSKIIKSKKRRLDQDDEDKGGDVKEGKKPIIKYQRRRQDPTYRGVYFDTRLQKHVAQIYDKHHEKHLCLGTFDSEVDAARRYDEEALKLFGPKAFQNLSSPPGPVQNQRWVDNPRHMGVHFDTKYQKYMARLRVGKTRMFLGRFNTEEEAIARYEEERRKVYGESRGDNLF